MGWDVNRIRPCNLSERELGMALGNGWALPVSAHIVQSLNNAMGWQPDAEVIQ